MNLQSFYRTGELLAKGREESSSREPHANNLSCQTLSPLSRTQDLETFWADNCQQFLGAQLYCYQQVLLPVRVNAMTSPSRMPVALHETRIG